MHFPCWHAAKAMSEQTMVKEKTLRMHFPCWHTAKATVCRWDLTCVHSKLKSISYLWKRLWWAQLFFVLLLSASFLRAMSRGRGSQHCGALVPTQHVDLTPLLCMSSAPTATTLVCPKQVGRQPSSLAFPTPTNRPGERLIRRRHPENTMVLSPHRSTGTGLARRRLTLWQFCNVLSALLSVSWYWQTDMHRSEGKGRWLRYLYRATLNTLAISTRAVCSLDMHACSGRHVCLLSFLLADQDNFSCQTDIVCVVFVESCKHNTTLHFTILVCHHCFPVSLIQLTNTTAFGGGGGGGGWEEGPHSFTAFFQSHWPFWCGTVGSDPTLSLSGGPCVPSCYFLSRGPRAPLSPSLAWALRTPPPPLSLSLLRVLALRLLLTWALIPHLCFAQLVPYHFLLSALSLVTPPACPKSLLCLSDWSFVDLCDGSYLHLIPRQLFWRPSRRGKESWSLLKSVCPTISPANTRTIEHFAFTMIVFFFQFNSGNMCNLYWLEKLPCQLTWSCTLQLLIFCLRFMSVQLFRCLKTSPAITTRILWRFSFMEKETDKKNKSKETLVFFEQARNVRNTVSTSWASRS